MNKENNKFNKKNALKVQSIGIYYEDQVSSPERSSTAIIDYENQQNENRCKQQQVEQVDKNQSQYNYNTTFIKVQPIKNKDHNEDNNAQQQKQKETEQFESNINRQQIGRRRIRKTKDRPIIFETSDNQIDQCKIGNISEDNKNHKIEENQNIQELKKETMQTANQSSIALKEQMMRRQIDEVQSEDYQVTTGRFRGSQSKRPMLTQEKCKTQEFYYYQSENTHNNQSQSSEQYDQSDDSKEEDMMPSKSQNKQNMKIVQKTFQAQSLTELLFSHLPAHCSIQCLVICRKKFLSTTRSYDLYLKKQKKYLITAIKNRVKIISTFQFKYNPYKNIKTETLATLKSNFSGLQYTFNKKKSKQVPHSAQLLHLQFLPNILGLSHRSLCVTQNRLQKRIKIPQIVPFSLIKNYLEDEKNPRKLEYFNKFNDRKATKNMKGQYQMDYGGVAKLPSPNNLVIEDEYGHPLITIGKVTDQIYALKISAQKNGFSIGEGFAVAVSNLDYKLFVR